MSSSERPVAPTPSTTEIAVATGDRYRVNGTLKDVERIILDAARGSIMQFAWLTDTQTQTDLAVNPNHVTTLRALDP